MMRWKIHQATLYGEASQGDDQTVRGDSEEGERGGFPELPVVRMPPDRPPDDANANAWREYNRKMSEWNEVQLQDIAARFQQDASTSVGT